MSPTETIKRLLQECTPDERRAIFDLLRQEFPIHPLEAQLGAKAEVFLRALARASDLTMRGVRGIIAEEAFITARHSRNQKEASGKAKSSRPAQKLSVSSTEIIAPGPTSRWQDVTPPGNHSYDFLLQDGAGPVRVQVKLQRQKQHRPWMGNEAPRYCAFAADLFVVETQRTRTGTSSTGEKTRPYRFGEFDLLGVCLHPSTGNWTVFVYTVADWLLPDPDRPGNMLKYQPVSTNESDGWTRDFDRCVSWLRAGHERRICDRARSEQRSD